MTSSPSSSASRTPFKRYLSSDGFEILVGRSARDNDMLTFKIAGPHDFWFHVAATSGSHVVVVNPDQLERLPRNTLREAAELAALHSKSRDGGNVAVHYVQRNFVRKERGAPAGQVTLQRKQTIQVSPQHSTLAEIVDETQTR